MESDPSNFYSTENFAVIFSDIMQAGIDSTSGVNNFIVLLLASHPRAQDKLYREIEYVLGDRLPTVEDRSRMIYAQCAILEGLRWSRVAVLGVPRAALADIPYRNYIIKKGTVLISNLETVCFEPSYWGDPHVFRPERFLGEGGSLDTERAQRINLFGAGKRACVGEALARDMLFLFLTSLVQKFEFKIPPGVKPNLEPIVGITLYPHPYHALVSTRQK